MSKPILPLPRPVEELVLRPRGYKAPLRPYNGVDSRRLLAKSNISSSLGIFLKKIISSLVDLSLRLLEATSSLL
jgi:hypothetical protein